VGGCSSAFQDHEAVQQYAHKLVIPFISTRVPNLNSPVLIRVPEEGGMRKIIKGLTIYIGIPLHGLGPRSQPQYIVSADFKHWGE